jgi:hypothetical protein
MTQKDGETETIGGDTYRVRFIEPLTATDIAVDLAKMFAPVLASFGGSILSSSDTKKQLRGLLDGDEEEAMQGASESIERAILGLLGNLSKDQMRFLISTMAPVTEVQKGQSWPSLESVFPVHFRGRPSAIFKWLAFAMRVNFKGFFSDITSVINRVVPQQDQDQ